LLHWRPGFEPNVHPLHHLVRFTWQGKCKDNEVQRFYAYFIYVFLSNRAAEKLSPEHKKEPPEPKTTSVKCELTITQVKIDTFIDYPADVKSPKERECYRLFKKMSDKGLNVSYDTVLRGMLTPTELRVIQKQREIEKAKLLQQQSSLAEESEEGLATENGAKVEGGEGNKVEA
jgi:hypothetical protein